MARSYFRNSLAPRNRRTPSTVVLELQPRTNALVALLQRTPWGDPRGAVAAVSVGLLPCPYSMWNGRTQEESGRDTDAEITAINQGLVVTTSTSRMAPHTSRWRCVPQNATSSRRCAGRAVEDTVSGQRRPAAPTLRSPEMPECCTGQAYADRRQVLSGERSPEVSTWNPSRPRSKVGGLKWLNRPKRLLAGQASCPFRPHARNRMDRNSFWISMTATRRGSHVSSLRST